MGEHIWSVEQITL